MLSMKRTLLCLQILIPVGGGTIIKTLLVRPVVIESTMAGLRDNGPIHTNILLLLTKMPLE